MAMHPLQTIRPQSSLRRLLGGAALVLALAVTAPAAHAQWAVNDAQANGTLGQISSNTSDTATNTKDTATNTKDTVTQTTDINSVLGKSGDTYQQTTINGRLDAINQKFKIGTYDETKPGARVKNPDQALPTSGGTALDDGSSCTIVAQPQQPTCKQIVALENAQYQYMLVMYENTKTRDDTLRSLLKERSEINSSATDQFGRLEDNTNKLTALYNLIALDHQQMLSVNYAYDANIKYLRAKQTQSATAAATGKDPTKGDTGGITIPGVGNIGNLISGLVTGVALSVALDGAQTAKPDGMKTLQIGKSKGF